MRKVRTIKTITGAIFILKNYKAPQLNCGYG